MFSLLSLRHFIFDELLTSNAMIHLIDFSAIGKKCTGLGRTFEYLMPFVSTAMNSMMWFGSHYFTIGVVRLEYPSHTRSRASPVRIGKVVATAVSRSVWIGGVTADRWSPTEVGNIDTF